MVPGTPKPEMCLEPQGQGMCNASHGPGRQIQRSGAAEAEIRSGWSRDQEQPKQRSGAAGAEIRSSWSRDQERLEQRSRAAGADRVETSEREARLAQQFVKRLEMRGRM